MKRAIIGIMILAISIFSMACNKSTPSQDEQPKADQSKLSVEDAKSIAIEDAKVNINEVEFVKEEYIVDDGVEKYEIEFYHNNQPYDYELDAISGDILEMDNKIEDYTIIDPTVNENDNTKLSVEQAKEIAMKDSNLTSDKVNFTKEEYKVDNGIGKYDIEFSYNNTEYNYEIDANNGNIIKYEKDGK